MEGIEEEIKKIQYEIEMIDNNDDELPEIQEVKEKPKLNPAKARRGQTRERMMELHKIRSEKAKERRELKEKQKEVEQIKKDKINFEYEQAKQLKEALEKKKASKVTDAKAIVKPEIKEEDDKERKEKKNLYKSASRDILKEKYLEEAKRRVMMDLFS